MQKSKFKMTDNKSKLEIASSIRRPPTGGGGLLAMTGVS
jgi:hypothetical protein